mgnify:CR=1 FL=1
MSGLVGTLRAINADDPVELHDLGGYDAAQVAELVQGAFAQPFPARAPVKVCIFGFVLSLASTPGDSPWTPIHLNAFPSILTPASP